MEVKKAKIGNALTSSAANHVVAVSEDIYDESKGRYQSDINEDAVKAKVVADKAAADIGVDSTTLLQGGIDAGGSENSSSYFLRTGRYSTFKLEVNNGYTVGQIAQYDLAGNFVALYNGYTQIEGVEWTPQSVVATDKNYYWVAIVFKGNSPNTTISYREDVVKSFASGLYYYMEGSESDPQSAAQQAKTIVNRTIEQLPNEEDLTLSEGKMQLSNRAAATKDGKIANLGYVILRQEKSFAEQVVDANTIYEVRYEFDLNGKEVEMPANCALKFNGGKIINGTLKGKETTIEAQLSQILNSVILKGTWANDYFYPEWLGANGDDNINDTDAIQLLINAEVNVKLLAKKYKANITWNSRSSIIGSGQDKTILEPFDNSKPVILVDVQTNTSSYAPLAYTNRILSDLTIHSGLMDAVVAVPTGVGVQMSVEGGKSNVGVIEFTRCAIVGFEYGIKKSYGGLGGNVVNCNFDKNDFHYYAYATSSTSHSGCTLFHKNHFMRSYKAAIYIEYTAAIGGGQDIFDNNIFEHNRGFIFFIKGFKSSTTEMRITNNWFEENSLGNFVEKNPNDISIYDFAPVEINGETYDLAEIYLESSSGIVVENCLLRALTLKSSKITLDSVTPTTSQRYNIPREFVLVKDNESEVLYKNAVCGTSVIETIVDSQIKLGLSTGSVATNIIANSVKNMPAGRTPSIFRVKNKTRKKALVNSADSAILTSSVAGVLPFSYNYSTSMPALNGSWKPMTVIEDDSLLNKNYNRAIITAGNTGGFLRGCSVTLDSNIFNYYVVIFSVKSDNSTSPLYIAFGNNAGVWINANDITSEWRTFAVLCNATNWRTVERSGNIVIYTGKYGSAEVTEEFVLDISYLNVIGFSKAEDALSYVNGDYIIDNDMTAEIGTYNTLPTQVTTGKQVYDKDLSKPVIWNGIEWSDALDRKANNADDSKPMGMGYKVLSPNKSFAEQVTEANTIYEIRNNFDLGGKTVTLKEGCTLKFEGGMLSNGTLVGDFDIKAADKKIFDNVQFDGECVYDSYDLDWFVSKKNKSVILDGTQLDATEEIQMALDSGILNIYVNNRHYYYINSTLELKSYVSITGERKGLVTNRITEQANPCFYTDKDIIVFNITASSKNGTKNINTVNVKGISIRRYGTPVEYNSTSGINYKIDIPTIRLITGENNNDSCWGVNLDVDLYAADKVVTVPSIVDGVASSATTMDVYMHGYTGVEIYARGNDNRTDEAFFTYIKIDGTIYGFRRAIYTHSEGNAWLTDLTLNFDSNVVYGGDIEAGSPVRIRGSHQSNTEIYPDEPQHFFNVKSTGIATGIIWDLNAVNNKSNLTSCKYPYKAPYSFQNMLGNSQTELTNSILPSGNPTVYRRMEYLYKFLSTTSNYLEGIFLKLNGWRVTENAQYATSPDTAKGRGTIDALYLWGDSHDDRIELTKSNVTNYNKLFKLSSEAVTSGSAGIHLYTSEMSFLNEAPGKYVNYYCKITIPKLIWQRFLNKGAYFTAMCSKENAIESLAITTGEQVITQEFSGEDLWYSFMICSPIPNIDTTTDVVLEINGKVQNLQYAALPKIGLMSYSAPNVITSSGGEIVGRMAMADIMEYSTNRLDTTYRKNDYIGRFVSLDKNKYTPILRFKKLYSSNKIFVEFFTNLNERGCVYIEEVDGSQTISTDSSNISIRLYTIDDGTYQISVKPRVSSVISISSVSISGRLAFYDVINNSEIYVEAANPTAGNTRPTNIPVGYTFFDTTLSKPIWWTGEKWIDSTGTEV